MPKRGYAVVWREETGLSPGAGPCRNVGTLVLDRNRVRLEGGPPGDPFVVHTFNASVLDEVQLDRTAGGRISGRPAVVFGLRDGTRFRVASLDGPGTASEFAHRLAGLAGKAA
jgi:hypothetical protein